MFPRNFPLTVLPLCAASLFAQAPQLPRVSDLRLGVGIQFTGIYTTGAQADLDGDKKLDPVDDRFDIGARRARFSVSGTIAERVDFRVVLYYDNIGRDRFTGTRGTPGDGKVGVWDAFWMWRANPRWANVTIGYFRPQLGRESITSGFQTNSSMDKLPTQIYQRAHMVGRNNGRETGINLGGLYLGPKWSLNYNVGFFDTSHEKVTGQENGAERWSPLVVSRVALSLGDPEMRNYGIDYLVNYFSRRNGVTLASSYARQGETNVFHKNETIGFDVLANYRSLNLDAELDVMKRTRLDRREYSDHVWHVRTGYNIPARATTVEPVIAYMRFTGDRYSVFRDGKDELLDLGINWYLRETRVKLNLHHTRQKGAGISNVADGTTFLRGNMVGLGLQFVY